MLNLLIFQGYIHYYHDHHELIAQLAQKHFASFTYCNIQSKSYNSTYSTPIVSFNLLYSICTLSHGCIKHFPISRAQNRHTMPSAPPDTKCSPFGEYFTQFTKLVWLCLNEKRKGNNGLSIVIVPVLKQTCLK